MILRWLFLTFAAAPVVAATHDDPRGLIPVQRPAVSARAAACGDIPGRALSLPDLVDIALCRNPQTAISFASLRAAAAQSGVARSAELPTVDLAIGPTLSRNDSFGTRGFNAANVDTSARLAVNYLLFDFGGRAARIDAAAAQQRAALALYADAAQGIILSTVTAYNALLANAAVETANIASAAFARQSRDLAAARQRAGVTTGADRLQAETALSQAELVLIQTRGNLLTARAQLAVTIGLPPATPLDLAPPQTLAAATLLRSDAAMLITEAERLRPDIAAARANTSVADANLRVQQALGRPSVNFSAANTLSAVDTRFDGNIGSVGVSVSVPIFSGFNRRYNIAAARAETERQAALAEQTRQQAGLEVYSNHIALETAVNGLAAARALIASAGASADLARGRYQAGVGIFADLLNAQSALANARQQLVQSEFNVRTANAQLARAVGGIGDAVDAER